MKIYFENKSAEITAVLSINDIFETLLPGEKFGYEVNSNSVVFSVVYNRDFTVKTDEKAGRIADLFFNNIGNLIVQIKNTYKIDNLADGDTVELYEKAHYVPTTKREAVFKCVPAPYYFGQAECEKAQISIDRSVAINHDKFIKTYKQFSGL